MLCITDVPLSWAVELNRISFVLFLVIGGSVHQKVGDAASVRAILGHITDIMLNWKASVEIIFVFIQYETLVGVTSIIFDNTSTSEDIDNQKVGILALLSCFNEMHECFF